MATLTININTKFGSVSASAEGRNTLDLLLNVVDVFSAIKDEDVDEWVDNMMVRSDLADACRKHKQGHWLR